MCRHTHFDVFGTQQFSFRRGEADYLTDVERTLQSSQNSLWRNAYRDGRWVSLTVLNEVIR